jgi:hypothetical protein
LLRLDKLPDVRACATAPAIGLRDAAEITSSATPSVTEIIPGWRATGSLWEDQRFCLRVPARWNGRLVVAGCPGQRTEFACDRIFGDPLLARGYAYVAGNKGNADGVALLESGATLDVDGVTLPRYPVGGDRSIVFWQHAPDRRIERWLSEMVELVATAREIVRECCAREPEATYAIGLSNGGYQVRRAVEMSELFDGALTWNPVLWHPRHNLCRSLSEAIGAIARDGIEHLTPLERKHAATYWYVTLWLHATHLDPQTSIAYGDVRDPAPAESWIESMDRWNPDNEEIGRRIDCFANTGTIRCKTIELGSELDHLTPPDVHLKEFQKLVVPAGKAALYRSRTIARATHVDSWADDPQFPQLRSGYAEVMSAWDELVAWVEGGPVK